MSLLHHAMLEPHTIEYLQRSHAQAIRLSREYFRWSFVDHSGLDAAARHPVRGHEPRRTGADDEPFQVSLGA